ncbi:MAG: fumarylacetoacetate hydrolase family protein [Deltaproteobacteria bacterium]|nr:fumarylacetoacetate hydrolase family protein [Deltaproteobacteria bacterium]
MSYQADYAIARLELPDGRRCYAELRGDKAHLLSHAPWRGGTPTGETVVGLGADACGPGLCRLAPVEPSKILCVGRNYAAHAAELGHELPAEPLLFFKPPSALVGPDDFIELPPPEIATQIEHEIELGVVVGRRTRGATLAQAEQAIFGYTVVGDITARDLQQKDKLWARAKGLDTFCPVGPVVVPAPGRWPWLLRCRVNGEPRQEGSTEQMVFRPADLVAYASRYMTLEPGDLIATGTPAGVGPLRAGDRLELEIEGIGTLGLEVRAAAAGSAPDP